MIDSSGSCVLVFFDGDDAAPFQMPIITGPTTAMSTSTLLQERLAAVVETGTHCFFMAEVRMRHTARRMDREKWN